MSGGIHTRMDFSQGFHLDWLFAKLLSMLNVRQEYCFNCPNKEVNEATIGASAICFSNKFKGIFRA